MWMPPRISERITKSVESSAGSISAGNFIIPPKKEPNTSPNIIVEIER